MPKSKFNFFLMIVVLSLMISCDKDTDNEDKDPGPVGGDSISVSSIIPEKPMWGDVITISGNGFGTNPANVEVFFPGNYVPILDTVKSKGQILELSNTQLKVRIPYQTKLETDGYEYPVGIHNGWGNLVIKVRDKPTYNSPDYFIYYRAVPFISKAGIEPVGISGVYIVPGEKVKVSGKGFGMTKTEGTLTVNGVSAVVDSVWYNVTAFGEGNWYMIFKLPPGAGSKSNELKDYTVSYSRFGRSYSRTVPGRSLPVLKPGGNTLPATITGGTSVTDFNITGESLYANSVRFSDGVYSTTVAVTGAGVTANQVSAFVPLAELLPRGDKVYNVVLTDTDVGGNWVIGSVRIIP